MHFNFLRTVPVNLLRYMPRVLAQDEVFKNTFDICSDQHEKTRLKLMDIARQFFVSTATWGLEDWERVMAIPTMWSEGYEVRRNRILLKLQGCQTSSFPFMNSLLNRYVNDSTGRILEHNDTYTFEIIVDIDKVHSWKAMIEAIDMYKPAHLAMYLAMQIFHEWKIQYRAECEQIVDAYQMFWNLGSARSARRDGEFLRDGMIRRTGKHPVGQYREKQAHRLEVDMQVDATMNGSRVVNRRDGTYCRDGSHRRNGAYETGRMVSHCCTVTYAKNEIEVIEYV